MRDISQSASSAAERELFEIFSGLHVVTMRGKQANAIEKEAQVFEGKVSQVV